MDLLVNSNYDSEYVSIQGILSQKSNSNSIERVYDLSKRFINKYGFSVRAIEMIYLLGQFDQQNYDDKK